jgi:glyoxylase-like metal-dependent hydrolase (beta-lactamase superfamily II)
MTRCTLATLSCTVLTFAFASGAQPAALYQATSYTGREIGTLTANVYFARLDDYVSAFMVTPDGIVLVEPFGTDFATWLKEELDRRFGVPVKYVIYSHSHADHSSGAAVFKDTARIIGHEALLGLLALPPASTQLPPNLRGQDANGNGRIERSEAQAQVGALFDLYDVDGNGALSGAEAVRGPLKLVVPPDLTYAGQVNITLGGKRVEVIPIPTDHAPDNTVVRFVDGDNVVFASDWITKDRMSRCRASSPRFARSRRSISRISFAVTAGSARRPT